MNLQETFTTCVQRLRAQGRPAMDGSTCLYEDSKGNRCAVGIMLNPENIAAINDAKRNDKWSTEIPVSRLFYYMDIPELDIEGIPFSEAMAFWGAMQTAHDDAAISINDWLDEFNDNCKRVANRYDLDYPGDEVDLGKLDNNYLLDLAVLALIVVCAYLVGEFATIIFFNE